MSETLTSNYHYLNTLLKAEPKIRKFIILQAKKDLIKCLSECVYNTLLNKQIDISNQNIKKLKKYRKPLRKLAKTTTSYKERRKIFLQKGNGFLPLILPSVLSLVTSLISK